VHSGGSHHLHACCPIPEQLGASRLVDASTTRIEIRWRPGAALSGTPAPENADGTWHGWDWYAGETRLPMRHRSLATRYLVQLHEWHPLGECYDGLPQDLQQAQARRKERLTISQHEEKVAPGETVAPGEALTPALQNDQGLRPYSLDLRYASLA
jgi:hypothetical protein